MTTGAELALALANRWGEIAAALGAERARVEYALLPLLRRLDTAADEAQQQAAVAAILALLQPVEPAYRLLVEALREVESGRTKGTGGPAGFVAHERWTQFPIFFGTDRAPRGAAGDLPDFGGGRGTLALGVAEVSVPDDARMGDLERAQWWKLEFRADPARHFAVHSIRVLGGSGFVDEARALLQGAAKKDVMVFMHGYNCAFLEALQVTAQLTYDLQFEGLAAMYSWPSQAALESYGTDEKNAAWAQPHFAQFIALLRERLGAEAVHVVAHSMGNRLLVETLKAMAETAPAGAAPLREVVFAAPDVEAASFRGSAAVCRARAGRLTLYASSKDRALLASRLRHRQPRAGEAGDELVVDASVDTVDASEVDTSLLGHSYYQENRSVVSDLFYLIRHGMPPQQRFGLAPKERGGARYWAFRR